MGGEKSEEISKNTFSLIKSNICIIYYLNSNILFIKFN